MNSKELLLANAQADRNAIQSKMHKLFEQGKPALAEKHRHELSKAHSVVSFIEGLSDSDADIVKRLLA